MTELNLTEDNKRELRSLVNALTRDLPEVSDPKTASKKRDSWQAELREEMETMMRRAFVPHLATQIYNSSPLTAALIANNAVGPAVRRMAPPLPKPWDDPWGAASFKAVAAETHLTQTQAKIAHQRRLDKIDAVRRARDRRLKGY